MAKSLFSATRLSSIRTLLFVGVTAVGVFAGGHAVLAAANLNPCDDECPFIDCEPPKAPGCGACGQYVEWISFSRAGDHCVSCMAGHCNPLTKIDIDHCGICEQSFVEQCQSCTIGL